MIPRVAIMLTAVAILISSCGGQTATPPGGQSSPEQQAEARCALGPDTALPGVPWQERPGMYEPATLPAAMDARSARLVVLQGRATAVDSPVTWTFDVCRNRWQRMTATLASDADVWRLVYHEAADLTLGIPLWKGPVRAYSTEDDSWTDLPAQGRQPAGISDAVYDPDTGLVIGWSDSTATLWSYDLTRRTWTVFPHGRTDVWPDLVSDTLNDWTGYTLMTYDTVRDAVLLAVFPVDGRYGSTWALDVATRRWTDLRTAPPALLFGYGEMGTEMTYDSAHGRAAVIGGGEVAVFDSSTGTWSRSSPHAWGDVLEFDTTWAHGNEGGGTFLPNGLPTGLIARFGHTLVYDPANEQVVMLGGTARMVDHDMPTDFQFGWWLTADTWAYDVSTNAWTQLVPEQEPLVMSGTYRPAGHGPLP